MKTLALATATALILGTTAATYAATIFSDSFDRTDSNTVGTNDNALGGTISQTWLEDGNLNDDVNDDDTDYSNDEVIASNALLLDAAATNSGGTAWVIPDHDFTDVAITSGGGFTMSYTVDPAGSTGSSSKWGALSLGHSLASAKDETNFGTDNDGDGEFVIVNNDVAFGITIKDNGQYNIFEDGAGSTNAGTFDTNPSGTEAYSVVITVLTDSFASGQNATISATVDGSDIDMDPDTSGTQLSRIFQWNTGSNYFNFESFNEPSSFDDIVIAAIPEPASLALLLLGVAAVFGRRRVSTALRTGD